MTAHLSSETLTRYAAGDLSAAEFLAADDHLTDCSSCREQLAASKIVDGAFLRSQLGEMETSGHLRYEELESFVDETADATDREIIESHLQLCQFCTKQVSDLRKLKSSLAPGFGKKIVLLWNSPEYSAEFRTVLLAAIFAFVALIISLFVNGRDEKLQAQLDEANQKLRNAEQKMNALRNQVATLQNKTAPNPLIASVRDSSGMIGMDQEGRLIGADHFPQQYRQLASAVFDQKRVPTPQWLKELQGQSEILMGEHAEGMPIKLFSPIGIVVESSKPEFRWQASSGAKQYRVSIYDQNFRQVASSSNPLSGTSWTPASDLSRGKIYSWKITAVQDHQEIISPVPPAPEAKFKILEQERLQELVAFRKMNSHLLLALAYADAGMQEEARSELGILSEQNPGSALIADLIKSLSSR